MNMQEIRNLSEDQIQEKIMEAGKENMNLRFQKATGQLENPNRVRELRKQVARLKTEQTARSKAAK